MAIYRSLSSISCQILTAGSRLSEVRLVEESQSMKDACKVMLEHITQDGRVRVGYGSSLLEEARAAGKGEITRKNHWIIPNC